MGLSKKSLLHSLNVMLNLFQHLFIRAIQILKQVQNDGYVYFLDSPIVVYHFLSFESSTAEIKALDKTSVVSINGISL